MNIVLLSCVEILSSPWIRRFVMDFLSLGVTGMYLIAPADISEFVTDFTHHSVQYTVYIGRPHKHRM